MTKRAAFIAGAIFLGAGTIVADVAIPAVMQAMSQDGHVAQYWYPGFGTWAAATVIWYLICGLNAIKEWNRRPVLKFGRYHRTAGPGLVFIEPIIFTTLQDVPIQDVTKEISAPNIQTKDNVGVGVIAILTYRVDETKVRDAVVAVKDIEGAILMRALSTMNDVGSTTDLDQFLEHRDTFGGNVVEKLRDRVKDWGVTIHALELKAFKINDSHVEQAIAMKARAEKEAAAELVRANMQKQIAHALNEAATVLDDNGWKLKGMEVLVELCRSANNNTIVIPSDVQAGLGSLLTARTMPGLSPSKPAIVENSAKAA